MSPPALDENWLSAAPRSPFPPIPPSPPLSIFHATTRHLVLVPPPSRQYIATRALDGMTAAAAGGAPSDTPNTLSAHVNNLAAPTTRPT